MCKLPLRVCTSLLVVFAVVVVFVVTVPVAVAQPAQPRLVLATDDVELRRALETELEPWHVTIVMAKAPSDAADAEAIAFLANNARYIVWRERDDLLVYDRELRLAARRKASVGAFDATSAASAAASVKTLLRLPAARRGGITARRSGGHRGMGLRLDLDAAGRRSAGRRPKRVPA